MVTRRSPARASWPRRSTCSRSRATRPAAPSTPQPKMSGVTKTPPPVRKIYADQLVSEGVLSQEGADELAQSCYQRLSAAHSELKETLAGGPDTGEFQLDRGQSVEPDTK